MSSLPTPIPLVPEPCPGRRSNITRRLWPICCLCDVQDDSGQARPAAVLWADQPVCMNRRFHGDTVAEPVETRKAADLGGTVATSSAGAGLAD